MPFCNTVLTAKFCFFICYIVILYVEYVDLLTYVQLQLIKLHKFMRNIGGIYGKVWKGETKLKWYITIAKVKEKQ